MEKEMEKWGERGEGDVEGALGVCVCVCVPALGVEGDFAGSGLKRSSKSSMYQRPLLRTNHRASLLHWGLGRLRLWDRRLDLAFSSAGETVGCREERARHVARARGLIKAAPMGALCAGYRAPSPRRGGQEALGPAEATILTRFSQTVVPGDVKCVKAFRSLSVVLAVVLVSVFL